MRQRVTAIASRVADMTVKATRDDVLRYRVHAQQLDRTGDHVDSAVFDIGVQDSGYDGAAWALATRGGVFDPEDHFVAWTLRGAPHVYRRSQAAGIARATAPWSDADAAKRIFDAAKPLKAAGISILDALATVAGEMRNIVDGPTVKGDVSAALTEILPEPYLRWCRPCQATHSYEQTFRIAALGAGLELESGTSPPVLRRLPRWKGMAARVPAEVHPVRSVLRFLGPSTPKLVAEYIDSPVREVKAQWPEDTTDVEVGGERRSILTDDLDALTDPVDVSGNVRLLGNFDLFLQARDRQLLVDDEARRKALWPVLGRPGAVLAGHDIAGLWRPRTSGTRLRVEIEEWGPWTTVVERSVGEQAERLADFRGLEFAGVDRA